MLLSVACAALQLAPRLFTGWFGNPLGRALIRMNIVMALFNLLPIPPLDGAEAWQLLFLRPRRRDFGRADNAVDQVVKSALERARGVEK